MYKNLVELAKECPGLQVTITLGELIEANRLLIDEVKRELFFFNDTATTEIYTSRDKAMEILGVSSATLWR